jgi:ABC-2 type transport system permease protein
MFKRIVNLTFKEIVQLTRDWLMLVLIILGPTLELALLARSTGQGVRHLPVVVVDQDRSEISRQIVAAIDNTDELVVVAHLDSPDEVQVWIKRNQAALAVILPRGLQADLAARLSPEVQLIADGANSVAGSNALSAASGAISAFLARRAAMNTPGHPTIDLRAQVRFNPTLNVRHFAVTAQLGFIVYQVALIVAALGLTRERELGTLEQLLVTPLQRIELVVGKAIPALVIAGLDFVIMWAIIVRAFDVPMRGSFPLLLGLSLLFIAAEIGWGLTISALSHTQQQAVLMIFVLALVDVSFSGYIVPIERMPPTLQLLAQLFPLQQYLVIIRSVMLRGAGLSMVLDQVLVLVVLGLGSGAVALVSLRRRLD